jgi:PIN domain nuclease of toxin-antitoxin system
LKLLLDTHTLLWFALMDPQLSGPATTLIMDPGNDKLVSPASYWEIAIKISVKNYALSKPYEVFMEDAIDKNGFGYLHIEPKHTAALTTLPFHQKDPFDRLLIAQAIVESIPIISGDAVLDSYPITRLW